MGGVGQGYLGNLFARETPPNAWVRHMSNVDTADRIPPRKKGLKKILGQYDSLD